MGKEKESFFGSRSLERKLIGAVLSRVVGEMCVPHRVSRFCRRRAFSIGRAGWVSLSVSGDG